MTTVQQNRRSHETDAFRSLPVRDNHLCFACGHSNPHGLKMEFYTDETAIFSDMEIPVRFCGWKDVVHGGVVSTVLDEVMGWSAIYLLKKLIFTKSMTVDFIRPVIAGTPVTAEGRIANLENENEAVVEGAVRSREGDLLAKATGRFKLMSVEKARRRKLIDENTLEEFESFFSNS